MVTDGAPEIEIESRFAAATVSCVLPVMLPNVAVMVMGVALIANAVTTPVDAIVAIEVFEDDHVTVEVRSWVVPSL